MANVPDLYTAFHNLSKEHAYGVAILAKNALKPIMSSVVAENHINGISLSAFHPSPTFFSLYGRPSAAKLTPFFEPFHSFTTAQLKNLIIAADINGRNPLWNSSVIDNNREEKWKSSHPLNLCNIPLTRLSYSPAHSSYVDVTLSGDNVQMSAWKFLAIDSLSDHPLIFFQIERSNLLTQKKAVNRSPDLKRIDQASFLGALRESLALEPILGTLTSTDSIDHHIAKLTNTILFCANTNKIKTRFEAKPNKMSW